VGSTWFPISSSIEPQGWDLISQTPYPEAALAAELGIRYVCVAASSPTAM
jgi:purine nucleoside phosphorylase